MNSVLINNKFKLGEVVVEECGPWMQAQISLISSKHKSRISGLSSTAQRILEFRKHDLIATGLGDFWNFATVTSDINFTWEPIRNVESSLPPPELPFTKTLQWSVCPVRFEKHWCGTPSQPWMHVGITRCFSSLSFLKPQRPRCFEILSSSTILTLSLMNWGAIRDFW